jgi:ankyrin repeat protein
MTWVPKFSILFFLLSAVFASTVTTAQSSSSAIHPRETPSQTQHPSPSVPNPSAEDEENPEDAQLAPAAVQLDVSKSSPLIQKLYQATRETKPKETLDRLTEAKQLLAEGTDVKATDVYDRTALHWTIFGSNSARNYKVLVAYEEIADSIIQRGVDFNHEDRYNDTALDYLLYSPNFEIQTLLIESGATSGFLTSFFRFFNIANGEMPRTVAETVAKARNADLPPGLTLSIRLTGPVYSDGSRTGDPVEGVVTYPLCKTGEDIACKPGELLVSPGTRVQGTVLFAQKAPDKYSRPRLVLDFSNLMNSDGMGSPLYSHVLDIDNARETVLNNEILGIVQPHANRKVAVAFAVVGIANPIAGYALKGASAVYGLSIRREVLLPAGTDLQVQIVRPSMLNAHDSWSGWPLIHVDDKLNSLITTAPIRTYAQGNKPSDVTNVMFIGSRAELIAAFEEAGWYQADPLSVTSALKTVQATIRNTDYQSAPVSKLLIEGGQPDLVFQKSLDTFAKRHHIRIWKLPSFYNDREVWVGAGTHDIGITASRGKTRWSHRIDPHVDRERDWIQSDLLFAGTAVAYANVDRPKAPTKTANATGDQIVTDGKMAVVVLGRATPRIFPRTTAALQNRQ